MRGLRNLVAKLLLLDWLGRRMNVVASITVIAVISVMSGLLHVLTSRPFPLFGFNVFAPSLTVQTYGEFIVVATYYIFGTIGVSLYFMAGRGMMSQRASRYALLGASLLIIIAALGLIAGMLAKRV